MSPATQRCGRSSSMMMKIKIKMKMMQMVVGFRDCFFFEDSL